MTNCFSVGENGAQPNADAISSPCMIPWAVVEALLGAAGDCGIKELSPTAPVRDEAALELGDASVSAGA